jgi:hypothetical protein
MLIKRAIEKYRSDGLKSVVAGAHRTFQYRGKEIKNRIQSVPFTLRSESSVDVMAEDWDQLVLLDACRYDTFAETCDFNGQLESRISSAGSSKTFVHRNFCGRELHDTVYITANPYVSELEANTFHAVHDEPLRNGFDYDRGTIPPSEVTEAAEQAAERYPHKRLIIHYMQPHAPPIGPMADQLNDQFGLGGIEMVADDFSSGIGYFTAAREGRISPETVLRAYRETLEIVLDDVHTLLADLEGRTVISADHGEYLGERVFPAFRRYYGHGTITAKPRGRGLYQVPWFVIEDERREITADKPTHHQPGEAADRNKLRALGYVE